MAVVGPSLRMRGIQGLRIIDCSVMPTVSSGDTNAAAIAIDEYAANVIKNWKLFFSRIEKVNYLEEVGMNHLEHYRVAVMHVAPVFLDTARTVDKACSLIQEAASNGAKLVVFPETFVPAFPIWSALRAPIYNHKWFCQLARQAVQVPGPEIARIAAAAKRFNVMVSIGINEGSAQSVGCIWNSNLLIGSKGELLNHHRKLVPTFWEKLVWANGDGAGLRVVSTSLGKLGMLICGENFNPLARFAMIAQGEQLHLSSYPPVWPAYDPREGGKYNVADAIRVRAAAHALEAKVFNVVCAAYMDQSMKDLLADGDSNVARILEGSPRGVSMVVDPGGKVISDILEDEEAILYAEIDLTRCVEPKQLHDLSGYYNRFDIFQLTVNRQANRPAIFLDSSDKAPQSPIDLLSAEYDLVPEIPEIQR